MTPGSDPTPEELERMKPTPEELAKLSRLEAEVRRRMTTATFSGLGVRRVTETELVDRVLTEAREIRDYFEADNSSLSLAVQLATLYGMYRSLDAALDDLGERRAEEAIGKSE